MAFSLLKKQNYLIGIITGEDTQIVQKRADKLIKLTNYSKEWITFQQTQKPYAE